MFFRYLALIFIHVGWFGVAYFAGEGWRQVNFLRRDAHCLCMQIPPTPARPPSERERERERERTTDGWMAYCSYNSTVESRTEPSNLHGFLPHQYSIVLKYGNRPKYSQQGSVCINFLLHYLPIVTGNFHSQSHWQHTFDTRNFRSLP